MNHIIDENDDEEERDFDASEVIVKLRILVKKIRKSVQLRLDVQ